MKLNILSKRGVLLIAGVLALIFNGTEAAANLEGRWVHHPAASFRTDYKQSQVDRILDGKRYVYFSVRGFPFHRNEPSYKGCDKNAYGVKRYVDPIQLFRYDKTLPWSSENIRPLAQEIEPSGVLPLVMDYSPDRGVFVVIYDNNAMDFIYDDGTVMTSMALADAAKANETVTPYSVTFDLELPQMYVAGSFGYAVVSMENGELLDLKSFDMPVANAGRIGDRMVVFAGDVSELVSSTSTYIFPIDNVPLQLNDPVKGADNLIALMPLTQNSFAAIAYDNTEVNQTPMLGILDGNSIKLEALAASGSNDAGSFRYHRMFCTDGYVMPAEGGYAVFSNSSCILLKKGIEVSNADEFKANAMQVISRTGTTGTERNAKAGTFDGKRFYSYSYDSIGFDALPRGFYYRDVTGNTWGQKSEIAELNAPTSFYAAYAKWTPEHGMIVRGPGSYYSTSHVASDFISAYKDGKWKDISVFAHYTGNPEYKSYTGSDIHIEVDPLNPNQIWSNRTYGGLYRIDLEDYSNFFGLGSVYYKDNKEKNVKGYFALLENGGYAPLVSFSNVDFDNDNIMWVVRSLGYMGGEQSSSDNLKEAYIPLYYFTPQERLKMNHISADAGDKVTLHEIRIPYATSPHGSKLIALKNPGNKNLIVFSHLFDMSELRKSFIFDHNGTPEDTSDDRIAYFEGLFDEEGAPLFYRDETNIYEDEDTGELWFSTTSGTFIINPSEFMAGNKICRRVTITKKFGESVNEVPFEQISIKNICKDNLGRKWIATQEGVYCLSAGNDELLAKYTTGNSPLPSDYVCTVECDRSSGSIFILTDRGMIEFQPEGSQTSAAPGEHLTIWPTVITPEYNGYVNISGADSTASYVVTDGNGIVVKTLGKPTGNTIQWNGKNNNGQKVGVGNYNIKREGSTEAHIVKVIQ